MTTLMGGETAVPSLATYPYRYGMKGELMPGIKLPLKSARSARGPKQLEVVGIGGALDPNSSCLAALRIAALEMSRRGAEVSIVDLREAEFPMYIPGTAPPEQIDQFLQMVRRADALIWATPSYCGAMCGAFTNALDWLARLRDNNFTALSGKVVGFIVSSEDDASPVVNMMELSARALGATSISSHAVLHELLDPKEKDVSDDKDVRTTLRRLARDIVRAVRNTSERGGRPEGK